MTTDHYIKNQIGFSIPVVPPADYDPDRDVLVMTGWGVHAMERGSYEAYLRMVSDDMVAALGGLAERLTYEPLRYDPDVWACWRRGGLPDFDPEEHP